VVWDLRLHGEPGGPTSITGTARFMLAIFYIVTTPLQDTRGAGKTGVPGAVPAGFQNAAMGSDQRFQAAASYSQMSQPSIGRRRILP